VNDGTRAEGARDPQAVALAAQAEERLEHEPQQPADEPVYHVHPPSPAWGATP